jgi:cytochrome o ubiquinol oxidase subunit 1
MLNSLFGRLTLKAFEHDAIADGASLMMIAMALGAAIFLTYKRKWKWLYDEWLTSLDPKRIGVMYLFVVFLMLLKGAIDGVMLRAQQATAAGSSGYLTADHFQQVFTAHGTTMIFFVGMGIVFGLANLIVPLQIGARDVAFPFLNAVSFWLFFMGFMLLNVSLMIGDFSQAGWVAYPPLSGLKYNPGVGVDYWIWSVQVAGVGSLFGGINFLVTIIKMRCPGMTYMKMPLFTWASLATMALVIFAFPILTVTITLLALDRLLDMHFFTADSGGNPMMYVNLIWAWGHPEVYILILPAFGVFSEVVSTFSEKKLFGYTSMVYAILAITVLSFIVWLHHFFTMGASPYVNAFFGAMTMLVAIPTGVKIFNWLFTMARGRIHLTTPMLWFIAFVVVFTIGGMAGVILALAPVDYQTHNSLFLIAHFHTVIIGGVVFGFFSGFIYWFPKFTGFKLHEGLGKASFWFWLVGFLIAFMPLYVLGFMGATRRLNQYDASTGWQPLFIVACIGAAIISVGIFLQLVQVVYSIKYRDKNKDLTGDPWNARTLEWSIESPPKIYNFARLPKVETLDPFWEAKQKGRQVQEGAFEDILLPKNTPMGLVIGVFSFLFGFAIIWYMWWLAILSIIGVIVSAIYHLAFEDYEFEIPAKEVEKMENEHGSR